MRGGLGLWLLAFLMLSACSAPATPAPASELIDVNVCYSAPSTTQSVPWYALEKGIFEKYGLRVNLFRVQGSSQAVTALITGDADICQAAGSAVVNAAAAGQDVVMIAAIYNTYPSTLVAKPEIKTVENLRGKRIGTGLEGSASAMATELALRTMGLDPEQDVILLQVGELPDRAAAFRANQIDAMLSDPPYLHDFRNEGVSELFDFGKSGIPFSHTSMLTTRTLLGERREIATNFMKAVIDAIGQMRADPEGAKTAMAKYMGLDAVADADDLTDAYENIILPLLRETPLPDLDGLQTVIDFAAITNPDAAGLDPGALVDLSIVQELEASGFIAEIQQK